MMPKAGQPDGPSSGRKAKKDKPLISVVPGTLRVARPKTGTAYAVQVPKNLKDPETRAAFAHLLMTSGVASGLTKVDDAVLVQIEGHRGVRLSAGQWLVVMADGAVARDDAAFRAAFDVDPVDDDELLDTSAARMGADQVPEPVDVSPSPVVTT